MGATTKSYSAPNPQRILDKVRESRYLFGCMRTIILCGILLLPTVLLGTSIIAIRTPYWVVIGVDSKATYRGTAGPPTVCKMYKSGAVYFVIGGLEHDSPRHFYPKDIIASSFLPVDDFATAVGKTEIALRDALAVDLQAMKRDDPETFRWTVQNKNEIMSVLMVEFRNSVPYTSALNFIFSESGEFLIKVERQSCPGDCPTGVYAFYSKKTKAGQQYIETHHNMNNPVQYVRDYVELESKESPVDVGPPIVILAIDQSGPKWIANEVSCPVEVSR